MPAARNVTSTPSRVGPAVAILAIVLLVLSAGYTTVPASGILISAVEGSR